MDQQRRKKRPFPPHESPPPEKRDFRFPFLKLPAEIREVFYKILLIDELYEGTPKASFMGVFWCCKQICSEFRGITSKAQPLLFASSPWNHFSLQQVRIHSSFEIEKTRMRFHITEDFFSTSLKSHLVVLFPTENVHEFVTRCTVSKPHPGMISRVYHQNQYVRAISHVVQLPWKSVTFNFPHDNEAHDGFYSELFWDIESNNIYKKRYFCRTSRLIIEYSKREYLHERVHANRPAEGSVSMNTNHYKDLRAAFKRHVFTWTGVLPLVVRGWICFRPISKSASSNGMHRTYKLEMKTVYDFEIDQQPPEGAVWEIFRDAALGEVWLIRHLDVVQSGSMWEDWLSEGCDLGETASLGQEAVPLDGTEEYGEYKRVQNLAALRRNRRYHHEIWR